MNISKIRHIIIIIPSGQPYRRVYTFLVAGMLIGLLKDRAIEFKIHDLEQGDVNLLDSEKKNSLSIFVYQWYDDLFFNSANRRILTEYSSYSYVTAIGRAATVYHEALLKNFAPIDFLMLGDVIDLIDGLSVFLENPNILYSTPPPGFAVKNKQNEFRNISSSIIERDLDKFILADRYYLEKGSGNVIAPLQMNKGCIGGCTFCIAKAYRSESCTNNEDRYRTPESIFKEIEYIHKRYGISYFSFCDDNFLNGMDGVKRAVRLADLIIESGINIHYYIDARCNDLDETLILKLKASGLIKVCIGVESGSQSVLDRLNKQTSIEQVENTIAILRKYNISFWLGFMMFEPRMSLNELKDNFLFIEKNLLHKNLTIERYAEDVIIVQGSVIYEELKDKTLKLRTQKWIDEQFGKDVLPGLKFYMFENNIIDLLRDYIRKVIRKTIREKLILKRINSIISSKDKTATNLLKDIQLTPVIVKKCEREIDVYFYRYIHGFVKELDDQLEYDAEFFVDATKRYDLSFQEFMREILGTSIDEIWNKLKY